MKKIAVFVEGQTEQVFVDELVRHIFGHTKVEIEELKFFGKEKTRRIRTIRSVNTSSSAKYLFRVYDCHGGNENSTVKSDIREQYSKLLDESFSYVIGIRDVYPLTDLNLLRYMMNIELPDNISLPVNIILADKEIKSWFLAEENHYPLIDELLNISHVNKIVGFDITTESTETIDQPSRTLKKVLLLTIKMVLYM